MFLIKLSIKENQKEHHYIVNDTGTSLKTYLINQMDSIDLN